MNSYRHDYHIHTRYSVDSKADFDAVCQAAVANGIDEIAFTDHLDFGPCDPPDPFRAEAYLAEIQSCRNTYGDRLAIRAGIEVGEPHLFAREAAAVLAAGDFDLVIGSAHYAHGMRAAWFEDYFDQPLEDAYEAYFQQVVDLAQSGSFDVLAHVDLIKRDARKFGKPYDGPGPYADLIRAALTALVERGKGMEINTSPLRRGQPEPCPSMEVLRWYHELGGEILTVGSDAHVPQAVGSHIDVALDMARAVGFTRLVTFHHREMAWRRI